MALLHLSSSTASRAAHMRSGASGRGYRRPRCRCRAGSHRSGSSSPSPPAGSSTGTAAACTTRTAASDGASPAGVGSLAGSHFEGAGGRRSCSPAVTRSSSSSMRRPRSRPATGRARSVGARTTAACRSSGVSCTLARWMRTRSTRGFTPNASRGAGSDTTTRAGRNFPTARSPCSAAFRTWFAAVRCSRGRPVATTAALHGRAGERG